MLRWFCIMSTELMGFWGLPVVLMALLFTLLNWPFEEPMKNCLFRPCWSRYCCIIMYLSLFFWFT